ncbi:LOW QUALITY PROTEIN: dynein axonemal heavy chain 6 [Bemisia tabaci]|uniref:LOW QUALITY PROTEIN: dynein axonemal heavy chain 6 n=1 Tax=Bemisia tabaci TaxID=7038 RepID=UPI003B28D221
MIKLLMPSIGNDPLILSSVKNPKLLESLVQCNLILDTIMHNLEAFLQSKRASFPRFYYLSNEELLNILSQVSATANNPHVVEDCIQKCFHAISKLGFKKASTAKPELREKTNKYCKIVALEVSSVHSPECEKFNLHKYITDVMFYSNHSIARFQCVKARGNVEYWLEKLEETVAQTLQRDIQRTVEDFQKHSLTEWLSYIPVQVLIVSIRIIWNRHVLKIFHSNHDRDAVLRELNQLNEYYSEILDEMVDAINKTGCNLMRRSINSLILVILNLRDTITVMVDENAGSEQDFVWLRQLKYFWCEVSKKCNLRMAHASLRYCYEYLGVPRRIAVTSVTDRCFLGLLAGLHRNFGSAVYGASNVGKTATLRELAQACGSQLIIFKAADGTNLQSVSKMLEGVAQTGDWLCFEEFSDMSETAASLIAQTITEILMAKIQLRRRFTLNGREVKLRASCSISVTMNVSVQNRCYAMLPDCLKHLLRQVSIIKPDLGALLGLPHTLYFFKSISGRYQPGSTKLDTTLRAFCNVPLKLTSSICSETILRGLLLSEGFIHWLSLAGKLKTVIKTCRQYFTNENHQYFGLRLIRRILDRAVILKNQSLSTTEEDSLHMSVEQVVRAQIHHETDLSIFKSIIDGVFATKTIIAEDLGASKKRDAIREVMATLDLEPEEYVVRKIVELCDVMEAQPATIVSGCPGAGKTTIINVLKVALDRLNANSEESGLIEKVIKRTFHPTSMNNDELFGRFDSKKTAWQDGVFGKLLKDAAQNQSANYWWVICDGPIDGNWTENLFTLMDDGGVLHLSNNEMVRRDSKVRILFEVEDFSNASPGLVSRCCSVHVINPEPAWSRCAGSIRSWASRLLKKQILMKAANKALLVDLFDKFLRSAVDFIARNCVSAVATITQPLIDKIKGVCALIEALLVDLKCCNGKSSVNETTIRQSFIFSALWGLGGELDSASKQKFETFVREQFPEYSDSFANINNLWTSFLDLKQQSFVEWSGSLLEATFDRAVSLSRQFVPSVDTMALHYVAEKMLAMDRPVLIVGPTGCGKSKLCNALVKRSKKTELWTTQNIHLSRFTGAAEVRRSLRMKLVKKAGNSLGAPNKKKMLFFIENVTTPAQNGNDSSSVEILRQLLDTAELYAPTKKIHQKIVNFTLLATHTYKNSFRRCNNGRLLRHFSILGMPALAEDTMKAIYKPLLENFLCDMKPLAEISDTLLSAMTNIFKDVRSAFNAGATPHRHVFNPHCLSEIYQGLTLADPATLKQPADALTIITHECMRVYGDRLVTTMEKNQLQDLIQKVFGNHFPNLKSAPEECATFTDLPFDRKERVYQEVKDPDKLRLFLVESLSAWNDLTEEPMDLIFFPEAIRRVTQMNRIFRLRKPCILVGPQGSGRRSIVRLVSYLNDCGCVEVEGNDSSLEEVLETLRSCYRNFAMKNKDCALMISVSESNVDRFLGVIHSFVNSFVPGLFVGEEYRKIIESCRPKSGDGDTTTEVHEDDLYTSFLAEKSTRIRLIICVDSHANIMGKLRMDYAAVLNACALCNTSAWTGEALEAIANTRLANLRIPNVGSIARVCAKFHKHLETLPEEMKRSHCLDYTVAGSNYTQFLALYASLFDRKWTENNRIEERIGNGLKKLEETNSLIKEMEAKLVELEPELKEKIQQTDELLAGLVKEKALADEVRAVVVADEQVVKQKVVETQGLVDEAQRDLDLAMPAVEAAMKAIDGLTKSELDEVRLLTKPPNLVRLVMEAVSLLLNAKTDWTSIKAMLSEQNFLKRLLDYDRDYVPDLLLKKLKIYLEHPEFIPELVAAHSKFAKVMCMWVRAIDGYAKVFRVVETKRKKIDSSEKDLNAVMSVLRSKQQKLAEIEARISKTESTYDKTLAIKANLETTIEQTTARLNRAKQLIAVLADEQIEWTRALEFRHRAAQYLLSDTLLAAGYVSYLTAFSAGHRDAFVETWRQYLAEHEIPCSPSFELTLVVGQQNQTHLKHPGLPRNRHFLENSLSVRLSNRPCLIYDPQDVAATWIAQLEAENNLLVVKATSDDVGGKIRNCVERDSPVLVTDFNSEARHRWLREILADKQFKATVYGASSEKKCFRLYTTTKVKSRAWEPLRVFTLVDFSTTRDDLKSMFLTDFMVLEQPEIETEYNALTTSFVLDTSNLTSMEERVLYLLYTAEGNALDSEELVETFYDFKDKIGNVKSKLADTVSAKVEVSSMRENYAAVAERAADAFLVIAHLFVLNRTYQFSLNSFRHSYRSVIKSVEKSEETDYIPMLLRDIVLSTYIDSSKSLIFEHRLVLCILMSIITDKSITKEQINFVLKAFPREEKLDEGDESKMCAGFLSANFDAFKSLPEKIDEIKISVNEKNEVMFMNWEEPLKPFEKVMLVKFLKSNFLKFYLKEYASIMLGLDFIEDRPVALPSIFRETNNSTPVLLISTQKSNPFKNVFSLAKNTSCEKLKPLTTGCGKTDFEEVLLNAMQRGEWLYLQACHLEQITAGRIITHFLATDQERGKIQQEFRFFYSAQAGASLDVSVLQKSKIFSLETSPRIKASLMAAFASVKEHIIHQFDSDPWWRETVYNCALFHAAVMQTQAWHHSYSFYTEEFTSAISWLKLETDIRDGHVTAVEVTEILRHCYAPKITTTADNHLLDAILDAVMRSEGLVSERFVNPGLQTFEEYTTFINNLSNLQVIPLFKGGCAVDFEPRYLRDVEKVLPYTMDYIIDAERQPLVIQRQQVLQAIEVLLADVVEYVDEPENYPLGSPDFVLNEVLRKEVYEYNDVLRTIRTSLNILKQTLRVCDVMTQELEDVFDAIGRDRVPISWAQHPVQNSLVSWMSLLRSKLTFIREWVCATKNGTKPKFFWLAALNAPRQLLAAFEQTLAERKGIPLTNTKLCFEPVSNSIEELTNKETSPVSASFGQSKAAVESLDRDHSLGNEAKGDDIFVHGLYLKGAGFDLRENCLVENVAENECSKLPMLKLSVQDRCMEISSSFYDCPMYGASSKSDENFVMTVKLPTQKSEVFWRLKDVHLILE